MEGQGSSALPACCSCTRKLSRSRSDPQPSRPQDERARKYAQEVQSLQFNILVTTYEFIMRDRSKLSKVGAAAT